MPIRSKRLQASARALIALLALAPVPAAAQIQQPVIGWLTGGAGTLHPIAGLPAIASIGDPLPLTDSAGNATPVISYACSAHWCAVQTASGISVMSAGPNPAFSSPAPVASSQPALIALDSSHAYFYFPDTAQLARLALPDGAIDSPPQLDFSLGSPPVDGKVLSIRPAPGSPGAIDLAVLRDAGSGIGIERYSPAEGSITTLAQIGFNEAAPPAVLLLPQTIVLADPTSGRLRFIHADATETAFDLPSIAQLSTASDGFAVASTAGSNCLLKTDPGAEQIFLLPPVPDSGASANTAVSSPAPEEASH